MFGNFTSGLLGGLIGSTLNAFANVNNLNDSLDSKSGWRKELFNVASKKDIGFDEVYRVRAALRLEKNDKDNENKLVPYSFSWMNDVMIDYLEGLMKKNRNGYTKIDPTHQEIIRIFCRFLLKQHWEYRRGFLPKTEKSKNENNDIPKLYAKETMEKICDLLTNCDIERISCDEEIRILLNKENSVNLKLVEDKEDEKSKEILYKNIFRLCSLLLIVILFFTQIETVKYCLMKLSSILSGENYLHFIILVILIVLLIAVIMCWFEVGDILSKQLSKITSKKIYKIEVEKCNNNNYYYYRCSRKTK